MNRIPGLAGTGLGRVWVCGLLTLVVASSAAGASEPQGINPTADLLKSMTYGDNIPGFRQVNTERNHSGPLIVVHDPAGGAAATGYIRSRWQSGDTLNELEITVRVCETPDTALLALRRRTSAILVQDPIEQQIGDERWARVGLAYGSLKFVVGRVAVSLIMYPANRRSPGGEPVVSQMDGRLDEVIRPLARGLEWVIRQHPDMMAETPKGQTRTVMVAGRPVSAPALTFGTAAWASLEALKQAGAKVAWDAKSGKATVSYGGKTVEFTALRRHARLNGDGFDLGAGVMVDRSGPIVPLRKVAEALGMKVKATKTTIEIG
ncbi:MAG: copper amine oxidase N-terminal domain-containing protein [Chthonomonadales bacterium]|nr:copper amine oxidase N-terminal domain-containing protein [Chthonomonadales bacterium]